MIPRFSWAAFALALLVASRGAVNAAPAAGDAADRVRTALEALDAWVGDGTNGDRWRQYLQTDALRGELAKGAQADPAVIARSLQRFRGDAHGLKLPRFVAAQTELAAWQAVLKRQYADDPAKLAWSARGDHVPISAAQFDALRADFRQRVAALEKALGGNSPLARGWKTYLKWELLVPHLADDFEPSRKSLNELDEVLQRIRSNQPGLELPVFVEAAKAIARYRALAGWATAAKTRDSRVDYERLLSGLAEDFKRHVERPTTETAWKVGRVLGVVDSLGQSSDFVGAIRERYAQPNILGAASANLVRNMPDRRVSALEPVRDCILGTTIIGTACTVRDVRYELQSSPDTVQLAIYLDGQADSQTRGYHSPVRINSSGHTVFGAVKTLTLSDDDFTATPAVAHVDTRTKIRSIQKTGGKFGRKLVEKIAWQRAMEQKRQAELISASHTRERVLREFNEIVARNLGDLRNRYEEKVRSPLIRRGATPEYLRMSSAPAGVSIETTFAARSQLAAYGPAPPPMAGHDIGVQIHESAVNNYLPLALAAARISQQSAEQPPDIQGNLPNWFKLMSIARPKLAAAANAGIDIVEKTQEQIEKALEKGEEATKPPEPAAPPFKPYSITLNAEAPVGVRFDDGQIVIRVRAALLASEDAEYRNWDFIVTYKISVKGDRILLERVGDIEVFPTGFDPVWDRQLTAQQSGFRSTLAKNMNARAKAGQSFPAEIPIEPIRISRFGVLVLRELVADDGWLTIGWGLP